MLYKAHPAADASQTALYDWLLLVFGQWQPRINADVKLGPDLILRSSGLPEEGANQAQNPLNRV